MLHMNTKKKDKQDAPSFPTPKGVEAMARVMKWLQEVDMEAPDAEANETSMSDNNGGRIIYVVIDGKPYSFNGNKRKTLELLQLLEGSLTPVSSDEPPHKSRK